MPLAALVVFLVGIILYYSRKEEDDYEQEVRKLRQLLLSGKMDKKNFLSMRNRIKHEKSFHSESKKLLSLLSDEKIDEHTYVRLRQVLEKTFSDRLDKLDLNLDEDYKDKVFNSSKA
jgi:uncharacterized protein YqgQ